MLIICKPSQSPKFKRVSLNETPEFPFWGLNICVDYDLSFTTGFPNDTLS